MLQPPKNYAETAEKLPSLVESIRDSKKLLIVTHPNPDPDSIGSAAALRYLAKSLCKNQATIAYKGIIGRAENRAMVDILRIHMIPFDQIKLEEYDAVAMLDHQPREDSPVFPESLPVKLMIDHHPRRKDKYAVQFVDIRKGFGSNSTIMTQYLQAAKLSIPKFIATSLIYGILTDTQNFARGTCSDDTSAYLYLFPYCDYEKLQAISYPTISPEYLNSLIKGISQAQIWDNAITTYAYRLTVPDMVSDIADRLVNVKNMRAALAIGLHENMLHLSLRVGNRQMDAGRMIRRVVGSDGSSGGHGSMAGGQVELHDDGDKAELVAHRFVKRFLKLMFPDNHDDIKPKALITVS